MAISFPTSPANNQSYSFNGRTWTYNGIGWQATGSPLAWGSDPS